MFELVNREAFNPSAGVNVTGIQENYLRLSIGQGASVSISLVPSGQDVQRASITGTDDAETATLSGTFSDESELGGRHGFRKLGFPNQTSFEIYLEQVFHEHVFVKAKAMASCSGRSQISGRQAKDNLNLLGHFCLSLAHRIFSNKVLAKLESLV